MRLVRLALVDHRQHGAAQSFGAAELLVARDRANGLGDETDGGFGPDGPMRHQEGSRTSVNERASQPGESLSALRTTCRVSHSTLADF